MYKLKKSELIDEIDRHVLIIYKIMIIITNLKIDFLNMMAMSFQVINWIIVRE